MNIPTITHATLITRELPLALATKLPFILRGAPGVGKTQSIEKFAAEKKIGYIDSRVLYFDPTDIKGFPSLDKKAGTFEWLPPSEFPLVGNNNIPDEGMWVFEELPSAAPAVQGALFQVLAERRIGHRKIKPGWAMVATGNRKEDKAVVNKMPSPMVSRLRHLELVVSAEDWATYAINAGIMPELVAFFRFRPDLLNSFDPKKWEHDTPYCCPRTAEYLSRYILALPEHQQTKPPLDILTGWVGEGVGIELYAFLELASELPSWAQIMANPTKIGIPAKPGHLYALSALITRNATAKNAAEVFAFLERTDFPQENRVHVLVDMLRGPRMHEIAATPQFVNWGTRNVELFRNLGGLAPSMTP